MNFHWKNRKFCLQRIEVMVNSMKIAFDKALKQALRHQYPFDAGYAYCNDPDQIPVNEWERLRHDAELTISEARRRIEENGRTRAVGKLHAGEGGGMTVRTRDYVQIYFSPDLCPEAPADSDKGGEKGNEIWTGP